MIVVFSCAISMPSIAETPWGIWGCPSPTPAWVEGTPPQLYGNTGGVLKPGFSETLKWYHKRTKNPKDREYCAKLLYQLEGDNSKPQSKSSKPRRVQSAAPRSNGVSFDLTKREKNPPRPPKDSQQIATAKKSVPQADERKLAYQSQLNSVNRLSRPKTAKAAVRPPTTEKSVCRNTTRPKSAMANIGRRNVNDPYQTTHELDFAGYPAGLYAEAIRPMSSKGFTAPYKVSDPVGATTCEDNFAWKTAPKVQPIRSGTSSGNRNNNPHPQDAFMVWRLPRKTAEGMTAAPAKHLGYRELKDSVLEQILKDQMKTTYQDDFLGIPQGFQIKDSIDAPVDWKLSIPRPAVTTVRRTYPLPEQQPELKGNTSRYGCNKNKGIAALGAVPTVTKDHVKNQELVKGKTSYESEFRNGYSRPNLDKLLKEQTNKKVVDSFLRYAKIQEQVGKEMAV
ncbi:uncharacterized protein LOC143462296 isoform X2 [Clavelina lepadiformis]|uniref:uncharacterized protein LOC143462296 isoform X2 n=1 Tax=Clavelina lepadiformis TaxID=159417 RepID=UPI0040413C1B